MWISGSLLLACLLGVASGSGAGAAVGWTDQTEPPTDPSLVLPPATEPQDLGEKIFTLRHIYHRGTHDYPKLYRYIDIPQDAQLYLEDDLGRMEWTGPVKLSAKTVSTKVQRMVDRNRSTIDALLDYAYNYGKIATLSHDAWTVDGIPGPDYTDKDTVIAFATMAANAYVEEPGTGDWIDVGGGFNYSDDFGWEEDGLRGHIFADETNKTIVIGLKGTSTAIFDGAETTGHDKLNDNLFGSCCCAQGGQYLWKPACECMTDAYTCNNTCLTKSLFEKDNYYPAVRDLYHSVKDRYPDAENFWVTGHSLGGVVSALLGLAYGLPVMTFEAFPDALAASRLRLPVPPGYHVGSQNLRTDTAIYHFGHTADPVYMALCNGATSGCTLAGYAFQSLCHTGKRCVYDTVKDLNWRVSVGTHRIVSVISNVLEEYDEVAECKAYPECTTDCVLWKFYESNGTEITTSRTSSSTRTRTRTETCETPGWWGCLDKTTTTSVTTTTSTSSTSTSTCKTPGWFSCKDPTTTTDSHASTQSASPVPTITTTLSSPTSTTSCHTPGWFGGCNDPTSTASFTPKPSSSSSHHTASATSTSTECTSRKFFGLICADESESLSSPTPNTAGFFVNDDSPSALPKADLRI